MRTSRIAKETARLFEGAASSSSSAAAGVLPRRSTRSASLAARFAYAGGGSTGVQVETVKEVEEEEEEDTEEKNMVVVGEDIEDAVTLASATRKRKRTVTTSSTRTEPPSKVPSRRTRRGELIKSEVEVEVVGVVKKEEEEDEKKPTARRPPRRPARKTTDATTGQVSVQPPSDWEEMYAVVKEMRLHGAAANAAVDTMGCERLAQPNASARDRRFHTLIALMLSSQTKDTVNAEAMARLYAELPACRPGAQPGLTLENILAVDPAVLNELIGKVGFHNNKTRYIKETAVILRDRFNSDIPPTIEGLVSLPGVGPKMAHLCMSATNGWNRVEGIGVDVHVHRITNLWGWQRPPTKTPEETRLALQSWLPRDKWKEINWLLVGLGQSVCLPIGRRCGDCELGLRGLCGATDRAKVAAGRRKRVEEERVKVEVKTEEEDSRRSQNDVAGQLINSIERADSVKEEEEKKPTKVEHREGQNALQDTTTQTPVIKTERQTDATGSIPTIKRESSRSVKQESQTPSLQLRAGNSVKREENDQVDIDAAMRAVKREPKRESTSVPLKLEDLPAKREGAEKKEEVGEDKKTVLSSVSSAGQSSRYPVRGRTNGVKSEEGTIKMEEGVVKTEAGLKTEGE